MLECPAQPFYVLTTVAGSLATDTISIETLAAERRRRRDSPLMTRREAAAEETLARRPCILRHKSAAGFAIARHKVGGEHKHSDQRQPYGQVFRLKGQLLNEANERDSGSKKP